MARITIEDCLEKIPNRFLLCNLAVKRVRQISEGSEYLVGVIRSCIDISPHDHFENEAFVGPDEVYRGDVDIRYLLSYEDIEQLVIEVCDVPRRILQSI